MSDLQILIDQYLSGSLDAEEKAHFEQRLAEDPQVAEAVELEKQLRQMVVVAGRRDLLSKMEKWEAQNQEPSAQGKRRWLYPLSIAVASLAIFIISTLALNSWKQTLEGQAAFDQYFEVYRSPINRRGVAEDTAALAFNQVMIFYQSQNYPQAINGLQKIMASSDATPDYLVQFYLGMSHLAQSPSEALPAIAAFQKVGSSQNDYQQQAFWYLALAELQLEDWPNCRKHLQQLISYQDYKKLEAQALLKLLPD